MHLHLQDHLTIASVQQAFTDHFPYLKIEFYTEPHGQYELSSERTKKSPDQTIESIKRTHTDLIIEITPDEKVSTLEKEFFTRTGLYVQILRKEKEDWIQTTGEDDFSLKELNVLGRNSSDEFILEEEDTDPGEEMPEKLF